MREKKPLDSELIRWAELRSSTVSAKYWEGGLYGEATLILIPSRSLADVAPRHTPLLDHVRLALLEQHFIEHEGTPDA